MSEKEVKFKYEIGEIVGVYKILDRWTEVKTLKDDKYRTVCYYKCQCTKCGNILKKSSEHTVNVFPTRTECMHCGHAYKYNIGDIIGHYEIIDRWIEEYQQPDFKYIRIRKKYKLKCLDCGFIISKREEAITDKALNSIKCRGCMRTIKYSRYKIGDILNNQQVIGIFKKQDKHKDNLVWENYYNMKCLIDGYEYNISQGNLSAGKGCPVCGNNKIMEGVNDIATIAPWMIPLFNNPDDAKGEGIGSHKKVIFKCPDCGTLTKLTPIYNIYANKHIVCRACEDGIPITEKFLFNILTTNNINFDCQKTFDWSENKIYDFYLKDFNTIIETHGRQHYIDTKWGTSKDVQTNDNHKKELALQYIDNYIIIDCSKSDYEFLLTNYKKSLLDIIDITKEYSEEYQRALKSKTIETLHMWNDEHLSLEEISEKLKINIGTVRVYLRRLRALNLLIRPYGISNK